VAAPRVIPGFGLSLSYTLIYLSVIVLLPLTALLVTAGSLGWSGFWRVILQEEVLSAYRFSFGASALAAFVNLFIGTLIAWVLARYRFFGMRFVDALIDLPFALPTAVAGIALMRLYSPNGWIGSWWKHFGLSYPWPRWTGFADGFPIALDWHEKITSSPLGVTLALMFVGLPFVVRTVQPVIGDMERETEEASASLGASRWQTLWRVVLPQLTPAILASFALAFARGLGEYGSVIFVAGKDPSTIIAPQEIIAMLDQYRHADAAAIAAGLLMLSFVLLLVINLLQRWSATRSRGDEQ
jgi:sulfate transport system permease protein